LWFRVLIIVPQPDWEQTLPENFGGRVEGPIDPQALYGTRLEVLDQTTGELVAELYTDDMLSDFIENGPIDGRGRGADVTNGDQ